MGLSASMVDKKPKNDLIDSNQEFSSPQTQDGENGNHASHDRDTNLDQPEGNKDQNSQVDPSLLNTDESAISYIFLVDSDNGTIQDKTSVESNLDKLPSVSRAKKVPDIYIMRLAVPFHIEYLKAICLKSPHVLVNGASPGLSPYRRSLAKRLLSQVAQSTNMNILSFHYDQRLNDNSLWIQVLRFFTDPSLKSKIHEMHQLAYQLAWTISLYQPKRIEPRSHQANNTRDICAKIILHQIGVFSLVIWRDENSFIQHSPRIVTLEPFYLDERHRHPIARSNSSVL
jgi:hypothetical protein